MNGKMKRNQSEISALESAGAATEKARAGIAISLALAMLAATVFAGGGTVSQTLARDKSPLLAANPEQTNRSISAIAPNSDVEDEKTNEAENIRSHKEEVVYANLSADGDVKDVYVVNILKVARDGEITDLGHYSDIKNLTSSEPLRQNGNAISVKAEAGDFSYQGTPAAPELPWNISVSYTLDGKKMTPAQIAGKNGHLLLEISATKNADADADFFENYLLQIAVTLDKTLCKNIVSDGTVANAGKNKMIAGVVMPGKPGSLIVEADVTDFSMKGIELSALPPVMRADAPDMSEFDEDLNALSDAIKSLNKGTEALKNGAASLAEGATNLKSGSSDYANGLKALNDNAQGLIEGSAQIGNALGQLSETLATVAPPAAEQVDMLRESFANFRNGLIQYTEGVSAAAIAYGEIDSGIAKISDGAAELHGGIDALHSGAAKLDDATADLPALIKDETDKLIGAYDKSDFEPASFADPENGKISSVQFVMKTDRIESPEEPEKPVENKNSGGFWERFLALFRS
jgi:X-X-X-Leu-X-X-Gly heptad repeat protein